MEYVEEQKYWLKENYPDEEFLCALSNRGVAEYHFKNEDVAIHFKLV